MTKPYQPQIEAARDLATFVESVGPAVWRITSLVHSHPEFFGVGLGESCMEAAARKLEELVRTRTH